MKTITILLVGALLPAACGTGGTAAPVDADPDGVILMVTDEGGFAPVEVVFGRHPRYVVQADRRVYSPGAVPAIYPGPMLTPIWVGTLDDATMQRISQLIDRSGLPGYERHDDTSATNTVADATTTVITYFDGTARHVLSVYALGIADNSSPEVAAAADLIAELDVAVAGLTNATEYRPTKVEIRTGEQFGLPDPEFRTTLPWPLDSAPSDLPETEFGFRCAVVEGPPAIDLLEVFAAANQATVWEFEGVEYPLLARGLMPGETGCA